MFPRIELSGTPFQRGWQHGRMGRGQILGSVRVYAELFAACGIAWRDACARAWAYRAVIGDLFPSLLRELEGMAAGSGLALDALLALNARTEILPNDFLLPDHPEALRAQASNRTLSWLEAAECTAVAVSGSRTQDGHTRLAQNWDWVGRQRDHLLLLAIQEAEQPAALILTEAGMLGKIGVNAHGLAIGLNILRATNDRQQLGVPVHVFQRAALACPDVQAVVALAQALSFAASSNAMLADAKGNVASLEYNPAGVAVVAAEDGVVAHSNHFLSEALAAWQAPLTASITSQPRLACARARIAAWPRRIDTAHLEALLRDQTEGACIAREPDPGLPALQQIETVCGVIIDCQTQSLSIAPDVPSRAAFTTIARAT